MMDETKRIDGESADARRVVEYLRRREYQSAREIANDLGMDEAQYSLAARRISTLCMGIRRDSYGREVVWLADAPTCPGDPEIV